MSTNGPAVVLRMRDILREDQAGRAVYELAELREAINRHVHILARELGLGTAWQSPLITLAPGTLDYTLPSTNEYQSIQYIRFSSDRVELPLRSIGEVLARREGAVASGRPSICALRPTSTQAVVLMVDTDPDAGEDVEALTSLAPDTWDAADATAPTYALSEAACRALELRACASVVSTSGPEKRNALAIADNAPDVWNKEAARLIELEQAVIIRLKRSRGALAGGWFVDWSQS